MMDDVTDEELTVLKRVFLHYRIGSQDPDVLASLVRKGLIQEHPKEIYLPTENGKTLVRFLNPKNMKLPGDVN